MKRVKDEELQEVLDNFLPFDNMFRVNTGMVDDILIHELKSINKGQFYVTSVLQKLDKYNEIYLKDLDEIIDKVVDSTGDLDIHQLNKLISYSTRMCSELYNNMILNISKLEN